MGYIHYSIVNGKHIEQHQRKPISARTFHKQSVNRFPMTSTVQKEKENQCGNNLNSSFLQHHRLIVVGSPPHTFIGYKTTDEEEHWHAEMNKQHTTNSVYETYVVAVILNMAINNKQHCQASYCVYISYALCCHSFLFSVNLRCKITITATNNQV